MPQLTEPKGGDIDRGREKTLQPVATFVHISDLHIGEVDPSTGNARTDARTQKLACTYRLFQGALGHQARSLEQLENYFSTVARNGEPEPTVLVTGDYSRCGHLNEFSVAERYLSSQVDLHPPRQFLTGLGLGRPPLGVPGNHDHWGGLNSVFSPRPTAFWQSVLASPGKTPAASSVSLGRIKVTLLFVDSDADVSPTSSRRWLAHGAFVSQLRKLSTLPPKAANELRVMVLHHSAHPSGHTLRMTGASLQELTKFVDSHGVKFLLCGHTHKPHISRIGTNTWELCSGSATQIDTPAPGWTNIHNQPPTVAFEPNSFLVHRLFDDGQRLWWYAHTIVRSKTGAGFVEVFKRPFRAL